MRKIFIIHSSVCELVASCIIKKYGITNPIIITLRNYSLTRIKCLNTYNLSDIAEKLNLNRKYNCIFLKRHLTDLKLSVDTIIHNEKFDVYIPQSSFVFFQFFINSDWCNSFSYLEEGVANYRVELYEKRIFSYFHPKKYLYAILNKAYSEKFRIVFNNVFFQVGCGSKVYLLKSKISRKHKNNLPLDVETLEDVITPEQEVKFFAKNDAIVIMSPIYEQGLLSKKKTIKFFIETLSSINANNIYIKLHPKQLVDNYKELCSGNIKFIGDGHISDFSVINKGVTVYGFYSSMVAYLSAVNEVDFVSLDESLAEVSKSYEKRLDSQELCNIKKLLFVD